MTRPHLQDFVKTGVANIPHGIEAARCPKIVIEGQIRVRDVHTIAARLYIEATESVLIVDSEKRLDVAHPRPVDKVPCITRNAFEG